MGKDKEKDSLEKSLAAAFRAVAGVKDASLFMRESNQASAALTGKSLTIPKLDDAKNSNKSIARGMADSAALFLRYHNPNLHKSLMPPSAEARLAFNAAERARVESLGILQMPGMAENINADVVNSLKVNELDAPETSEENIPFPEIIAMLVRERIAGLAPPPEAEEMMKKWGYLLKAKGSNHIAKLDKLASNQTGFVREINAMIADFQSAGSTVEEEKQQESSCEEEQGQNEKQQEQEENGGEQENQLSLDAKEARASEQEMAKSGEAKVAKIEELAPDYKHNWDEDYDDDASYKIYSREFDQIVKAEDLCDIDELHHYAPSLMPSLRK